MLYIIPTPSIYAAVINPEYGIEMYVQPNNASVPTQPQVICLHGSLHQINAILPSASAHNDV